MKHNNCILLQTVLFTNWRSVATLHQASVWTPFFQWYLLTSHLNIHILVILIFQTFSFYYYIYYGDLWSVIFDVIIVKLLRLMEKAMAPHSSTLAWKIPRTEEPGGLQSTGSRRVGHDWVTLLSLFTFTHWRRKWQPTPGFLPGESQGRGSLVGCRLWGRTESDMTEAT